MCMESLFSFPLRTFALLKERKESMAKKSERLLEKIRRGETMSLRDKLDLIGELSVPSMLAQLVLVLMFFIDAAMVGHLGAEASASIGLIESTMWLTGGILSAVALGFSVQASHFIGANDFFQARQVFRHALLCGLGISSLLCAVGVVCHRSLPFWLGGGADIAADAAAYYLVFSFALPFLQLYQMSSALLKSAGNMRVTSAVSVAMCVLDVLFNFLFIYVFHGGVVGAALGTALAYVLSALFITWIATCRNKMLALGQDNIPFRWGWSYVRNAFRLSLPIALQSVFMSGAQVVSTLIVAPLGNIAIAAHSFAITAESLCYMPGNGIGDAATTLVGQAYGARRPDLCHSFARLSVVTGMCVMAVMGILLFFFAADMMAILSPVDAICQLGTEVLRIEAFAEPFFAASIVVYSVCVAMGDTLRPVLINLFSMWCVRLTMAALLAPHYGLKGVWVAMALELTFRGILFLVRLARLRMRKDYSVSLP